LGWPPTLHWVTISCLALSSTAPSAASYVIYFVWDSSKGKSTGSDLHFTYKRYYNLVCVLKQSNLGWPPTLHWATISCLPLSTSCPSTASKEIYFVCDSSKGKSEGKSTGSDHHFTYKRYYNLVCVLKQSNMGWPPTLHWATISCLPLFTSCPSTASKEIYFVWDSSKGKSDVSGHHLTYTRYYNLICVLWRSNSGWLPISQGHDIMSSAVLHRTNRC